MPSKSTKRKESSSEVAVIPETREQKLVRLANKRVANAIAKITVIGNLAAYKPTGEQIEKIMTALGESCARVQNRLEGTRKDSVTFTLTL